MEPLNYQVIRVLNDVCNNNDNSRDVEGLLVATDSVHSWTAGHDRYGHWSKRMYPAFYEGKKAWVARSYWVANQGYSATMYNDTIISFEEGVTFLLKEDAFKHLFQR
jgi:hypothetical protein